MMPIQVMVVPVWVERLGWMLVHSLWQLAIVAVLAAVASIAEKSIGSNAVRCGGCDAGFDGNRACCDLVLCFFRTSSASILVAD